MQSDAPVGADWQEIRVDLGSLQRLTDELSSEVSYNLQPSVSAMFDRFQSGVAFGATNPSVDLHAVKLKYHDCLQATVDRLSKYLIESGRLVDVANVILAQYRSTDALASASLDDLRRAFETANIDGQRGG
jgi:hypothetical protein